MGRRLTELKWIDVFLTFDSHVRVNCTEAHQVAAQRWLTYLAIEAPGLITMDPITDVMDEHTTKGLSGW